jgi:hypothetical protein
MNNFTQKEIQDIELVYRSFCGDGRILTDLELSIMKKLRDLVENSCNHEYYVFCFDCGINKCSKCGNVYYD